MFKIYDLFDHRNIDDLVPEIVYYGRRYNAYAARFEKAKKKLEKINEQKANQQSKRENIETFMETLKGNDHLLTEFDEELWCATVDRLIVHTAQNVTFVFKDGTELPWHI